MNAVFLFLTVCISSSLSLNYTGKLMSCFVIILTPDDIDRFDSYDLFGATGNVSISFFVKLRVI